MKKLLWSLLIGSMCFLNGYAQNLRVHVESGESALPFSYVSINGHYLTAADSTGIASLPKNSLKIGDTISARTKRDRTVK